MMMIHSTKEFFLGTLKFIPASNSLYEGEKEILLTRKETELLEFFCLHPGKILKREEILFHVWGKNDHYLGRSMDVFITRLRKILKGQPVIIETIHQIGYRLNT
jgi:DNA-binding response OmpR family regulator